MSGPASEGNGQHQDGSGHDPQAAARRSGRRPGFTGTRADILQAARKIFAERGYQGASMRAIAREAHVDAALIHHFFASKDGVFSAAVRDTLRPEQILRSVRQPGRGGGMGERLVLSFLELWDSSDDRDPMLAILRSAVTDEAAALLVSDFITNQVIGHLLDVTTGPDRELRAALIAANIIGLLMVRYVIKTEPLASLPAEAVAARVGPTIDVHLAGGMGQPPKELTSPGSE